MLAIPASLTSLRACLAAADHLVGAAEAEAAAMADELDADETDALQTALGAGGTGKGTATMARGMVGAIKDLERRQKSRATRTQRDALDRALVDLAAFYRDVLLVQARSHGGARPIPTSPTTCARWPCASIRPGCCSASTPCWPAARRWS